MCVYLCMCAHVDGSHRLISSSSFLVHHLSFATEPRANQLAGASSRDAPVSASQY